MPKPVRYLCTRDHQIASHLYHQLDTDAKCQGQFRYTLTSAPNAQECFVRAQSQIQIENIRWSTSEFLRGARCDTEFRVSVSEWCLCVCVCAGPDTRECLHRATPELSTCPSPWKRPVSWAMPKPVTYRHAQVRVWVGRDARSGSGYLCRVWVCVGPDTWQRQD